MKARTINIVAVSIAVLAVALLINDRRGPVEGQQTRTPGGGFAAVTGLKGGQDVFGPYDPVQNWPRPLGESLPNHEAWTWSQATDVFAESPDRVIVAQKGELPVLPSGRGRGTTWLPQLGPSIKFPVGGGVPVREAASATSELGQGRTRWQRRPAGRRLAMGARHRGLRSQRQDDRRLVAVGQDLGAAA